MYTLVKKTTKHTSNSMLELIGYEVKISRKTIVLYNQLLIDLVIKEKLYPEFNKIIKTIIVFMEEESDPDTAPFLLDELSRVYTTYLNNYEKYLSDASKDEFMKNIHVLSNELKTISRKKHISKPAVSKGRTR